MKPNKEKLIEQLVENTRTLLEENWGAAERVFGTGNIKLSMAHLIDFEQEEPVTKTALAFGTRVKDTVEVTVHDNGNELPMEIPKEPRKPRRKPVMTEGAFGGDAA